MLIADLRAEYERNATQLRRAAAASSAGAAATRVALTLTAKSVVDSEAASPYEGKEWSFDVTTENSSIPIGRSKAKKFIQTGVSLAKDNGVSTSHAKVFQR